MKRILAFLLVLALCLSGCSSFTGQPYSITYLDLFDTVTTVTGMASSQQAFQEQAQQIYEQLKRYHQLFDIYQEYPGLNNLKTVNESAGVAPVQVDEAIIALLKDCKVYYELTQGKMNIAMGSVLRLWHQSRQAALEDLENSALPEESALETARHHMDMDSMVLDETNSTVYLTDPQMSLDVGAVAKGWAVQQVAKTLPEGLLISIGGSVYATGPKDQKETPWIIGVENPDGGEYLHKLSLQEGSVATSGDYQRFFTVDGVNYHHIIDPDTGMPATHWRSVTVVCRDAGLADVLSTALFVLPLQEGKALADQAQAEVMWLDHQGQQYYTDGFESMISK